MRGTAAFTAAAMRGAAAPTACTASAWSPMKTSTRRSTGYWSRSGWLSLGASVFSIGSLEVCTRAAAATTPRAGTGPARGAACGAVQAAPRRGLLAVAVGVARDRALHFVADAVPGITRRMLGIVPRQARLALGLVPARLQVGCGGIPAAGVVLGVRVDAVAIGRAVVVVTVAGHVVVAGAIGVGPVFVFGGRVDQLGHALAGQATSHGADGRADHRAGRAGDSAGGRTGGQTARSRADAGAHRVRPAERRARLAPGGHRARRSAGRGSCLSSRPWRGVC